jgi:citrate lyase gamma subunit
LSAFNASSASVYTVLVTPINQGSVTLDVASNVAIDSVSNGNTAAAQHTVDFDSVVPSVMISGSASVNAAFTATVTFSEDVIGFVIGDITVSNASLSAFSASSASEYTVLVTPTTDGALTLDVSSSVATDAAANNNSAATQFSASFDNTSPTVSITDAVADPHNAAFTATVTFSEDVTGFDVGDISAGNASLSAFNASSASVYTVLVTPINQGSVTLDVAADAAITA